MGEDDGWICFHAWSDNPRPKDYIVNNFYHHSLVSVIKEKIMNPVDTSLFHYKPYELKWHPPHQDHNIKLYDELFMSTTFLNAHQALQDTPPESDCDLPCVVIALMFWLGSTQLTIFGDTKLWLLYFFFDNESKYLRCQPTNDLCSHAMYFQMVSAQSFCEAVISHLFQVPNELKDFLAENLNNKPLTEVLHTYCQ